MKGIQMTLGCMLLIVAGLTGSSYAAYTMNETCLYIQKGFIADPANCSSYGYCENGTLISVGDCPKGTFYNADDGVCSYKPNCRLNTKDVCVGTTGVKYVADPLNCSVYYYCANGVSTKYSCPQYQVFDPVNTQCNWSTKVSRTCDGGSICLLVQNNVFAADPKLCGNYILCNKGNGLSTPCGNGKYFSPLTGMCQKDKYCPGAGNDDDNSSGNTNSGLSDDPTKCNGQPDNKKTFVRDGQTCYGFYICTGNGKGGIWGKCPINTHFNGAECVTPYTYPCPYDRCGNTDGNFMGAIGNSCRNYLNCQNGQSIYPAQNGNYEGTPCGKDYFFDEYLQLCVKNSPTIKNSNYKLCPAVPAPPGSGK